MDKSIGDAPWRRTGRRFLLAFAPFLFLLLCVGLVQLWNQVTRDNTVAPTAVAVAVPAATRASITSDEALLAHTPAAPPTATSEAVSAAAPPSPTAPVPALPEGAAIELLGPPPGSTAAANAPLSFYWAWPEPLQENQRLTLYLVQSGEEVALGSLETANLGASFHLRADPNASGIEPGQYGWEVRLEQGQPSQILLRSETRRVILE